MSPSSGGAPPPRRVLRTLVPAGVSVAALVALVVAADPGRVAATARHIRLAWLPVVVLLSAAFFVVQGLRWHLLLRTAGVRLRVRDTVVLNIAGQATALLPLGELTRAVFVARAAAAPLGVVVATVTVQELVYTLMLVAAAVPGSLQFHAAAAGVVAALAGTVLALVILTVDPVFRRVLAVVRRTPLLGRLTPTVEQLQADTVGLLRHPETYLWSWLSALQGLLAITTFWLVAVALGASLGWHTAALVYAVSHIIGAVSLVPGGLGAYEAGASGLLVAVGVRFSLAATSALCEKLATKGLGTLAGAAVYIAVRRRYGFEHGGVLTGLRQARSSGRRPGDVVA